MNLKPAGNVVAAMVAGSVSGVSDHLVVKYGVTISPDTQIAITVGVMTFVAHIWDLVTGQNVPASAQGQAPPPPIAPPVVK